LNRQIVLRPEARRDLAQIWSYTEERWGTEQAEHYTNQLRAKIEVIAKHPDRGTDCDELYSALRRTRAGSHLIYYLADEDTFDIVRILHERRDTRPLLNDD
jgi:toxin ParE1/3/4